MPPGAASSQTAWRVSCTARRAAPQKSISQQVPPGGITLTARRQSLSCPLSPGYRLADPFPPPGTVSVQQHSN